MPTYAHTFEQQQHHAPMYADQHIDVILDACLFTASGSTFSIVCLYLPLPSPFSLLDNLQRKSDHVAFLLHI